MIVRALFWLGYGWRGRAFAALCGVLGALFMLSVLLPYQPYDGHGIRVKPAALCGDAEAKLLTTREWSRNWHQSVDSVRVSAQWQDVNTDARYPAFNGPTFPTWSHPTGTVTADIRLPVPTAAGEYKLLLAYDIEGRVLLAPRHQNVPPDPTKWMNSTNTLIVKDCTA